MTPPFIVYGLPRSRTFWLSRFLSYGGWECGHDQIRHARSMDDVTGWLSQPCTGTVETLAAPWWRLAQAMRPDLRTVIVRRPVGAVVDSLMRLGLEFDRGVLTTAMRRLDRKLDQIECRVAGVLSVRFDDLASEATCAAVFEHCLPFVHDPAWFATMAPLNLQVPILPLVRYYRAFQGQLEKLAQIAKHQAIADMSRRRVEIEGMTIGQESFDTFLRDGAPLFAEHLVQVGEAPDAYMTKNLPLMREIERLGGMQITTARSNGRMFGYLMAVISPSLESPGILSAMHLTFFASKDVPGLGMKLQRASVEGLRARGVHELFLRAGTRGSGPKMGSLYRRMGALPFGEMFMLDLRGA